MTSCSVRIPTRTDPLLLLLHIGLVGQATLLGLRTGPNGETNSHLVFYINSVFIFLSFPFYRFTITFFTHTCLCFPFLSLT